MGLGNVLLESGRTEDATAAYEQAAVHARDLLERDSGRRERRLRDQAICLYGLATVNAEHDPAAARENIDEAIQLAEAIVALSPDNARRPRDLALMLVLRGRIRTDQRDEVDQGVEDFRRGLELLTIRAVESPLEPVSRTDLHDTALECRAALGARGRSAEAEVIIAEALGRLRCVAEAQRLAGHPEWDDLLSTLAAPGP